MHVSEIETPAALVDRRILQRNTRRMAERAHRLGVRLRPHVKTHKTLEGARHSVEGHSGAITVSTLAEARAFARGGFGDILWAFPCPISRLPAVIALARSVGRLRLTVDHEDTVTALERALGDAHVRLSVFLEVDCGDHRAGVDPDGNSVLRLSRRLYESPYIEFGGLLTHAGQAYRCRDREEIAQVARHERDVIVGCAERLRSVGIEIRDVSVGSTPTAARVDHLRGVTEMRPGNYVFHDLHQAAIGSCELSDLAFSVLATVVAHHPDREELLVDAGALALSKDAGPTHTDAETGFGVLADLESGALLPHLVLTRLSQEHGQVRVRGAGDCPRVGDKVRIYPNHSCLSAAGFARYAVVEGAAVVGNWATLRGW